ncbi:MAG: hypothetical protein ABEJ72_04490 [Candidatus Aenigmatarchaeota archaeon]
MKSIETHYGSFSDALLEARDKADEVLQELQDDMEEGSLRETDYYIDQIHGVVGYDVE